MSNLKYPERPSIIYLLGGSFIMPILARRLIESGYRIAIFTAPRQAMEWLGHRTLATACGELDCQFNVVEDINSVKFVADPDALALGVGEAWVFGETIRNLFRHRLMDYMGIPLPRYRGGAHFTWAILRNDRQWGGCLQLVTDKTRPGEYDDGGILEHWEYHIPAHRLTPSQWGQHAADMDTERIIAWIAKCGNGQTIHAMDPPNQGTSLHFPRLFTEENGWIDWSFDVRTIVRTINAFGDPYSGAKTLLIDGDHELVVQLRGTSPATIDISEAPFQRGLVVRNDGRILIAGINGMFHVEQVIHGSENIVKSISVGQRFVTPQVVLDQALRYQPHYTPKGLT